MPLRTQETSDSVRRSRSPAHAAHSPFAHARGRARRARPGTAAAQDVRVVARDVPLAAARASVARSAPLSFTMVGIHWQGPGKVWFRTAVRPGRFGPWRPAQPEAEDRPDAGERRASNARAGLAAREPLVDGSARFYPVPHLRRGDPACGRTSFDALSPPPTERARLSADAATSATARERGPGAAAADRPREPAGTPTRRSSAAPRRSPTRLRFSVVHHTAGSNSYSAAQSAAIVRGIQRYHVLS